jgi:hypothetical protein
MVRRKDDLAGAAFGVVVVIPIFFSVAAGACVLLYQAAFWLKYASWPPINLQSVIHHSGGNFFLSQTGFAGFDKIADWFVNDVPLAVVFIVILPIIWGAFLSWSFSVLFFSK